MPQTSLPRYPRRELKIRLTESLYERLKAECGECGCTLNAVATLAISREIALRKKRRTLQAEETILKGQIALEGMNNA